MREDPGDLLRATYKLAKENNKLLHKLRRGAIIGRILHFLWIAFLIGLPIVLYYYFLQPIVGQFSQVYTGLQDIGGQAPDELKSLLEKIGIELGGE
jgi:hypothetical protein